VTQPKPVDELRGLVWGLDRLKGDRPEEPDRGEGGWYRSPKVLGGIALAAVVVLNLLFI
jgi:SSS family solute:Na+ symporter